MKDNNTSGIQNKEQGNHPQDNANANCAPQCATSPTPATNKAGSTTKDLSREVINHPEAVSKSSTTPMKDSNENKTSSASANSNTNPTNGHNHKTLIIISASIVVLLVLAGYGINVYNEAKAEEHQENLDLAVLCEENYNIEDYQFFLEKYPESKHRQEVTERMDLLVSMAESWNIIKNSRKAHDFVNFKNLYSDSHYDRLCNIKLDSIDWSEAKKSNSPDAYQAYINKNPNGLYVSEAIIAKGEVGYQNLTEVEIKNIRDVCHRFFSAMGVNNTDSATLLMAPEIESFMQMKSPSRSDITLWMDNNHNGCSLKTYILKDSIKSQRAFNEETGISYVSILNVEQITTDNSGNEQKETLTATVKQNRKFEIYSLNIGNIQ